MQGCNWSNTVTKDKRVRTNVTSQRVRSPRSDRIGEGAISLAAHRCHDWLKKPRG